MKHQVKMRKILAKTRLFLDVRQSGVVDDV